MSRPTLVGIMGVSGCGKDTAAEWMRANVGFERVSVADPIKATIVSLFRLSPDQLWGERRNVPDPWLGMTPRELFARFGKGCVELDPDVWLRPFEERTRWIVGRGGRVVCTDVRTAREATRIRELGGELWLLERPGERPGAREDAARIEAELREVVCDWRYRNEGSLADLYEALRTRLGG